VHLWDIAERKHLDQLTGHRGTTAALAVGPQKLISAGYDSRVRIWQAGDRVAERKQNEQR
jgi:WD40 repeat protein